MPVGLGNSPGLPVVVDDRPRRQPPVIPEIGVYTPAWYAPNGTQLALNPAGTEFFSLRNVTGLGAAPIDIISTPAADGGVIIDYVRPKERTVIWPFRLRRDTHMELVVEWRRIVDLFTQTRRLGPGRLRITRPDGTAREIPALYSSGLEQDAEDGAWTEITAAVNLLCPEPWWQSVDLAGREWLQEAAADYLNPYPTFGSGQVIGSAEMLNGGSVDAWPTWTIRGPMTSLVATNAARGESFTVTYTLARNESLTMTTRPIQVRGPLGQQAVNALNLLAGGVPWRLNALSTTPITFTAAGAAAESVLGAGDGTSVSVRFPEKYETA